MGTDALPLVIESGKEESGRETRPGISTREYNPCFGLVIVEFTFVYCHPGFDIISTLLQ